MPDTANYQLNFLLVYDMFICDVISLKCLTAMIDAFVLLCVTNGRFSNYTIVLYIISNNYTQRLDGLAQKRNISSVLPKMLQMVTVINPYSAGIDFRRPNLQTSDFDV